MSHPLRNFAHEVDEHDWPTAVCPTCRAGTLPYKAVTALEDPTAASWHGHERWEPDMIYGTFHGDLQCTNPACGQFVVITGTYRVVMNNGEPAYGDYGDLFQVKWFDPPLTLLDVPPSAPQAVKDAVSAAARIVWVDPSAAANRLRTAVERILDDKRVKKTFIDKHGKRQRSSAHRRIEAFTPTNKTAGDAMMAVKWVGNEGTHDSELSITDVLDGAGMLQVAVTAVYDEAAIETRRRIAAINRARGLPKKPRKKP